MIKLFNTLTRKKEVFKPLHKDLVGFYTCGPTVYNYAHIGNLRTYIFEDLLQRALEYGGYKVKRVMNITDVGHLTSDADTGEDKLEKEAQKEKRSVQEIAGFYTKEFFADLRKLNIKKPEIIAPATGYIKEQQELIKMLFEKGLAYETETAVYFDVEKYGLEKYIRLSRQPLAEKFAGAREEIVVDPRKKNAADFVLWFKLKGKFKNHILRWPSPWGEGFPGWHTECSAISSHFLGQPFDIHTGGVDHIGTHHTNEIAQSEGAADKPLAKIWMHGEFLLVDRSKMSKSEGNFFTLGDLEKRGFHPLAFRYLALGSHYRSKLNFSWNALAAAQNALEHIFREIYRLAKSATLPKSGYHKMSGNRVKKSLLEYKNRFTESVNDDLNTPKALSVLQGLLGENVLPPAEKLNLAKDFDVVLGLELNKPAKIKPAPPEVMRLFEEYLSCRANKQFIQSDALRKDFDGLGYIVEDGPGGSKLEPKSFFRTNAPEEKNGV